MSQVTARGGYASVSAGLELLGIGGLRARLSHVPWGRYGMCDLVSSIVSLNWTFFMVFLKPSGVAGLEDGVVFLMPLGRVTMSTWD